MFGYLGRLFHKLPQNPAPIGKGCSGHIYLLTDFERVVRKPLSCFKFVTYNGKRLEIDAPHGFVFKLFTSSTTANSKKKFLRELHMNILVRSIFASSDHQLLAEATAFDSRDIAFIEHGTDRYLVYNQLLPFRKELKDDPNYMDNAHRFVNKMHEAGWAHTDLHIDNLMTHPITKKAVVVDFESIKSTLVYPEAKDVFFYGHSMTGI